MTDIDGSFVDSISALRTSTRNVTIFTGKRFTHITVIPRSLMIRPFQSQARSRSPRLSDRFLYGYRPRRCDFLETKKAK